MHIETLDPKNQRVSPKPLVNESQMLNVSAGW
jgi:hypothetical protein